MNLFDPVSSIMTRDPITVAREDNLKKVGDVFAKERIHHLPVIDQGRICGILSKSDYLFFRRGYSEDKAEQELDLLRLKTWKVKDIMTTGIAVMEQTERINVALEVFKENLFHAIPIVENGVLKGILSTYDIIKHLATDQGAKSEYKLK